MCDGRRTSAPMASSTRRSTGALPDTPHRLLRRHDGDVGGITADEFQRHANALLPQPGGLEGLVRFPKRLEVNDPSAPEGPGVGQERVELDPGVPCLRAHSVDGYKAITGAENLLQLDQQPLVWLEPAFGRSGDPLLATIGLTDVVRQVLILVDHLRIEEGHVDHPTAFPGLQGPGLPAP